MQVILYRGGLVLLLFTFQNSMRFQNVKSNLCHLESYHWQHFIHLSQ